MHTSTINVQTVLLAEEDPQTREFLTENLSADGYRVLSAFDRAKALALLSVNKPDLIVLDAGGDTLDVIDAVRSEEGLAGRVDPSTPMIVLSAQADELHRIRVLERGGDDILAKPFSYPELRARIAALLRRAYGESTPRLLCVGPLEIDTASHAVTLSGQRIELCRREYELLVHLASEPERVFTKTELLRSVWGFQSLGATRTVDSHACRLRRKLSAVGGRWVVNVWGVGYRLI